MGNFSYDMTTMMVDEDFHDESEYFGGGIRSPGGMGASVSYKHRLGEHSSVVFTGVESRFH